jgi:RNA polymerase sigma-70 factor (ECF subfamily)
MDIVQSVWADIVAEIRESDWHFIDRKQLRAFLARLARNRFIDNCRKHRTALALEEPLVDESPAATLASDVPRPSEIARRNEAWDQMLALCSPAHHELLRLKRHGYSLSEIASRTSLHESSVRRILYNLASRYAAACGRSARTHEWLN